MSLSKFHSHNSCFISATEEITAGDLKEDLKTRILRGEFVPGTEFVMMSGNHHGKDSTGKVIVGPTDAVLTQGFYYSVFATLSKLEGKTPGQTLWEEKKFDHSHINIFSAEEFDMKTFQSMYHLSEITKKDLKQLANKLHVQSKPIVVIFASCYSYYSEIKDFLCSQGVLATLNLNRDKGEITQGRIFALDQQQREVLKKVRKSVEEDRLQHVFLTGSGGTGKTLLLVEILQMYLAHFKLKGVKTKALVITYDNGISENGRLFEDLTTKYLCNVVSDTDIKVMTFREACKGNGQFK